jgi:hypothetical protein
MTAFDKSASLLKHHIGDLHMPLCRLVKGGSYDLGLDAAAHISDLLRTLVYEEYDFVYLRMIVGYGVGYGFEQHGLTSLRLGHDEASLSLSDWGEHIHYTAALVVFVSMAEKIEFLVREERGEEIERNPVTYPLRSETVDKLDLYEREVLVALFRRTDLSGHGVPVLESVLLNLVLRNVNVIRRIEIIVVRRTKEAEAVRHDFKDTGSLYRTLILRDLWLRLNLVILSVLRSAALLLSILLGLLAVLPIVLLMRARDSAVNLEFTLGRVAVDGVTDIGSWDYVGILISLSGFLRSFLCRLGISGRKREQAFSLGAGLLRSRGGFIRHLRASILGAASMLAPQIGMLGGGLGLHLALYAVFRQGWILVGRNFGRTGVRLGACRGGFSFFEGLRLPPATLRCRCRRVLRNSRWLFDRRLILIVIVSLLLRTDGGAGAALFRRLRSLRLLRFDFCLTVENGVTNVLTTHLLHAFDADFFGNLPELVFAHSIQLQ